MDKLFSIIAIFFFVGCSSNPFSSDNTLPISGVWEYEQQTNAGHVIIKYELKTDYSYNAIGTISDNSVLIIFREEKGLWEQSGNKLTFTPTACFNNVNGSLTLVTCDEPYIYSVTENSMTDGSIVFIKK